MRIIRIEVVVVNNHEQRVDELVIMRHLDRDILALNDISCPIENRLKGRSQTRNQIPIRWITIDGDRRSRSIQRTHGFLCCGRHEVDFDPSLVS